MEKVIDALTLTDKEMEYVAMGIVLGVGLGIFIGLFIEYVEFAFAVGAVMGIIGSLIYTIVKRIKVKRIKVKRIKVKRIKVKRIMQNI